MLLKAGADKNAKDKVRGERWKVGRSVGTQTALVVYLDCSSWKVSVLAWVLCMCRVLMGGRTPQDGSTPLALAESTYTGNEPVVRVLRAAGATK